MKKKGNISLLVLFVLVACSLLGIIAVQYTRHIAIQTNQISNYYKAYYLAKGGSEIGLSLMQIRGIGYSLEINENSNFVKQNIITGNNFYLKIQGTGQIISNNNPEYEECLNPLSINSGQSLIIPLFIDKPTNQKLINHFSIQKFYKNNSENLKQIKIINNETPGNINIGIIISSGGQLNELGIFFMESIFQGDDFFEDFANIVDHNFKRTMDPSIMNRQYGDNQNYLIIVNKENKNLNFCLKIIEGEVAIPKTFISSFGYAGDKKIGLETIYQQPTPSYLIDSSIIQ